MNRKSRNIEIIVTEKEGHEKEIFQKRVNEIYCEIVRKRLEMLQAGPETKKKILNELIEKWK